VYIKLKYPITLKTSSSHTHTHTKHTQSFLKTVIHVTTERATVPKKTVEIMGSTKQQLEVRKYRKLQNAVLN
jgi:hypothetical protein